MNNKFISFLAGLFLMAGAGQLFAAELVNLNKADSAAIQQSLIGIGPIKAEAIISYRKKNGAFKNIDDLLNVKGIGEGLIKKNKKYLSLSKGAVKGDAKKYSAAKKQAKAKKSTTSASSKSKSSSSSVTAKSTDKSDSKKTSSKKSKKTTSSKSKSTTSSKKAKVKCKDSGKLVSKQSDCGKKTKKKKSKKKSSKKKKTPST